MNTYVKVCNDILFKTILLGRNTYRLCITNNFADCVHINTQKQHKETTEKCVPSELKESEEVKTNESIDDKSVTPETRIPDGKRPETRLQSKISELKSQNMLLHEECEWYFRKYFSFVIITI